MNNIKTYEGFLDFFKKKKSVSEPVYLEDIVHCLHDLTDEKRIKCSLNDIDSTGGLGDVKTYFVSDDRVFGIKPSLSLDNDYEQLMNDELGLPNYIKDNIMLVKFYYIDEYINTEDVRKIVEDCSSKLSFYDCKVSFYFDSNTEYKSIDRLFKKMNSIVWGDYEKEFYITMKIVALSDIKL